VLRHLGLSTTGCRSSPGIPVIAQGSSNTVAASAVNSIDGTRRRYSTD
jgi:hypothetical protein